MLFKIKSTKPLILKIDYPYHIFLSLDIFDIFILILVIKSFQKISTGHADNWSKHRKKHADERRNPLDNRLCG